MKLLAHEDDCQMVVGNTVIISEGRGSITENDDGTVNISDDYMPEMSQSAARRCTCNPDVMDLYQFINAIHLSFKDR